MGSKIHQRRKEVLAELTTEYENGMLYVHILQKRPYTAVVVAQGSGPEVVEFSKVCWPDQWDPQEGIRRAAEKALYELACKLVELEDE